MRRRMMMGKRLPYDAEIEYLESEGNAYINTGIKASGNIRFRTTLYNFFIAQNEGGWCFGAADGYLNKAFGILINRNDKRVHFRYSNKDYSLQQYSAYPQNATVEIGNGIIQIVGIGNSYSIETFTSNYSFLLFKYNNGGSYFNSKTKMGATYITNGVTTLDLIPVRVGTTGYMYDKVSGQLFGNAGTGQFILGPDKQ